MHLHWKCCKGINTCKEVPLRALHTAGPQVAPDDTRAQGTERTDVRVGKRSPVCAATTTAKGETEEPGVSEEGP